MTQVFSSREKHDEARRELAMRRRVYPRWVEEGRMKPDHAARQIAVMEAIAEDYRILAERDELEERLL